MNFLLKQLFNSQNANRLYLFLSLYAALFEYTSKIIKKRAIADEDTNSVVFNHLIIAGLSLFQGITILHSNGFFYGIIPQIRTLYENSVIYLYIHKHKSLAKAYYDHGEATQILLLKTMKPLDDKMLAKEKALIEKYEGEDFFQPYGWTKEVITNKKYRILQTLAEDIFNHDYSTPFYKHLSAFIHSNSFSVNSYLKVDEDYLRPFISLTLFLMNKVLYSYMEIDEIPQVHRVCIANLLDTITKVFFVQEAA